MKLKKNDRKILACLYEKYTEQHGSSMSKLAKYSLFIINKDMKRVLPELYESDPELKEIKGIYKELSIRGLVNADGNYRHISLTEAGYAEASKTRWHRFVEFLNHNPGFSILISLISLIVAIVALIKSTN